MTLTDTYRDPAATEAAILCSMRVMKFAADD
jgi:hypothetical protein